MKLNLSSANHMNITRTALLSTDCNNGRRPHIVSEKLMRPA